MKQSQKYIYNNYFSCVVGEHAFNSSFWEAEGNRLKKIILSVSTLICK